MLPTTKGVARVERITRWSPIWIVPLITVLIGVWLLVYHYRHQGPVVMLLTNNADGIVAGKTAIKSRSVNVGSVERVMLSDDLHQVEITARLNVGMEKLLQQDTAFWIVKPQIGREGVSGLGTLLSGAYIELQPGGKAGVQAHYPLLDTPPLAPPDAQGLRVELRSDKAGQLMPGEPVLFRGYRVGSVETSTFDAEKRSMTYLLFINAPFDRLVTTNVRFWKDSGVAVEMSAAGMQVKVGSLTTLLSGGVSFDVPENSEPGPPAANKTAFQLYDSKRGTEHSLYTRHVDFLLFFNDSIRGLARGAPVEFRGVQLGSVVAAPYFAVNTGQTLTKDYRMPVLIRIEPERFADSFGRDSDLITYLQQWQAHGLRAALKTGNLITGALYVDLDFYPHAPPWRAQKQVNGMQVIPTISAGLNQIQQKIALILDKLSQLPLEKLLTTTTQTLSVSQKTLGELNQTLQHLDKILSQPATQKLLEDVQQTLSSLKDNLHGLQPGTPAHGLLMDNLQQLAQSLQALQSMLKTLNSKSNALIFEARPAADPQPAGAKP